MTRAGGRIPQDRRKDRLIVDHRRPWRDRAQCNRKALPRGGRTRALGHQCVIVTSGAIAAGLPELGLGGDKRPRDSVTLQAVSAVGQGSLIGAYKAELRPPWSRRRAGAVGTARISWFAVSICTLVRRCSASSNSASCPVVNENDAIADDEIRFGDNDRLVRARGPPHRRRSDGVADRHRRCAHG